MIQTHMLKLDPPYQIIHAGGEVGLHIATLVVTKESETEDGKSAHGDRHHQKNQVKSTQREPSPLCPLCVPRLFYLNSFFFALASF